MLKIDLVFLTLAAACLLVGVSMGIAMGILHDFTFSPVHAHLNLVGWTSLALFGLTYRAYPALQEGVWARVHLALSGVSGPLFPLSIYLSMAHQIILPTIVLSLIWFAGVLLFLVRLIGLLTARKAQAAA